MADDLDSRALRGMNDAVLPRASVIIRPRTEADLAECVRLLETVHRSDGYPMFWPEDPAGWLTPSGLLGAWVAEEDGRVIGQIDIRAAEAGSGADIWSRATGLPRERLASVGRFVVLPASRGRGAGSALLDAACEAACAANRHPVLDVVETGAAAIRLYERRGWRRVFSEPWAAAADGKLLIHYYVAPTS